MIAGSDFNIFADSVRLSVLPTRQDRGTILSRGAQERKVSIFGDQDCRAGSGFIPNLPIGRRLQIEVDHVNSLAPSITQRPCQGRRKLRVDQKKQSLFRRYDRMVGLTRRKGQHRIDVGAFEIGIVLKDSLSRLACRQQAQNIPHRNAEAANARPAMHTVRVYRDPRQKV
jgi:hypothetical protein